MGLDMYLRKKIYVGADYGHRNIKGEIKITQGKDSKPIEVNLNKVTYIVESVGYWRKANAIHKFFVDYVQDGIDDCKEAYVEEEAIKTLIDFCAKDLEYFRTLELDPETNTYKDVDEEQLNLPTTEGFFFGPTEYTPWHLDDLSNTIIMLTPCLDNKEYRNDFYYQSSW